MPTNPITFEWLKADENANCNACVRGKAEYRLSIGPVHSRLISHYCGGCGEALAKVTGIVTLPELFEGMPDDEVPRG